MKVIIKIYQFVLLMGVCFCFILAAAEWSQSTSWYLGTKINGESVSAQTVDDYEEEEYTITVYGRDGESFVISGSEISYETDLKGQLSSAYEEQHSISFTKWLFKGTREIGLTANITFDEESVLLVLQSSVLVTGNDEYEILEPENSKIEWNGSYYEATEASDGNTLIAETAAEEIVAAITDKKTEVTLSDSCYETASVTANDLTETVLKANGYALHWITWDISGNTESLSPDELNEWITIDGEEVTFDESALNDFLEDICLTYKTVGTSRSFTTHDGETITVSGGDYGWRIDYSSMCSDTLSAVQTCDEDAISTYISSGDKGSLEETKEISYTSTGYQIGTVDWDPDNYSEVDISEQRVYVYKDGELAYTCICVTGLPDGDRDTTTGVWYIKDKKEEYTMTSETYGYTTDTKYWIRITWSGIGYHYMARSDWSSWSSSLYKTAGSHGCINLQLDDAKSIYNLVSIGDAVIIHQ